MDVDAGEYTAVDCRAIDDDAEDDHEAVDDRATADGVEDEDGAAKEEDLVSEQFIDEHTERKEKHKGALYRWNLKAWRELCIPVDEALFAATQSVLHDDLTTLSNAIFRSQLVQQTAMPFVRVFLLVKRRQSVPSGVRSLSVKLSVMLVWGQP